MTEDEARRILEAAQYWHYRFEFPWGATTPTKPGWAERVEKRKGHFWGPLLDRFGGNLGGKSVLDLGCCQGYWSFLARKSGARRVVGIDSCRQFVLEARAAATILGIDRCSFLDGHLEEDAWDSISPADITLFLGSLYHLADPLHALRKAASLTDEAILIDGEVIPGLDPILRLVQRNHDEPTTARSGPVARYRTVPSVTAITTVLSDCGFGDITVIPPVDMPADYHAWTTASILALR